MRLWARLTSPGSSGTLGCEGAVRRTREEKAHLWEGAAPRRCCGPSTRAGPWPPAQSRPHAWAAVARGGAGNPWNQQGDQKPGNRCPRFEGLYLAGGSVNPGAGVPMVLMGGQTAAACVLEDLGTPRALAAA